MDIITTPPYEQLQELYSRYFSLCRINTDINSKFAIISLTCYLTEKLKEKKPDVTHYQVLRKLLGTSVTEDFIKGLAVVCSDFSYGCREFPTFGIPPKEIPSKIKEIMSDWTPF